MEKTPTLARQNGRSIVPNRSALEVTVAGETKQQKTEDADACASGGAIGDNGSTMEKTLTLVRRLTRRFIKTLVFFL